MHAAFGLAVWVFSSTLLVHDDVVLRGEPFGESESLLRGASSESLAQAVYRARADAVVALHAPEGQGTGSLIRPDGWILTCAHVLGSATEVTVVFQGGDSETGVVVATDPVIDLALVKVEAEHPLPWVALADLAELEVGDPVVAIGHPKGFGWTVNAGIVSNVFVFREGRHDPGVIQSQVPLNPGNSGGPLLDAAGRLAGVIAQGDPTAQSLNWSISARAVKEFLVRHAYVLPEAELVVSARPDGAEILLDGEPIGTAPRAVARVPAGTHVVEVRKEGLGTVHAPFVVLQRQRVDLDVRLAAAGGLAVTADTDAVEVYVDGVLRGKTPLTLELASGPHTVTGVKAGTADSRAAITVPAGGEAQVALSHPPNRAFLSVVSAPEGAEVVVDGEAVGATPVESRVVAPGQHVVDVRVGESARRVVVDLQPEVHRRLEFDLRPPSAAAVAPASVASRPAPVALSSRAPRTWRRALLVSSLGAAVGSLSAVVLTTQDDPTIRAAAAASLVGGAAAFSAGPILLFTETSPGTYHADADPIVGAGFSARF